MSEPLRSIEYLRVLADRVPELEAEGWHPAAASRFSHGLGVEVVMVRMSSDKPTLRLVRCPVCGAAIDLGSSGSPAPAGTLVKCRWCRAELEVTESGGLRIYPWRTS